ncbi:MAG: CopG family ribbon-helix-helix protein [Nitrososphaerota archaeon]|jgi:CopG family nickel-responsive transcriptional regulator|nr:CopG family ribbon-helix-helix protein [Nitrososphaerota archaeon]
MAIISLSIPDKLIDQIDLAIEEKGYASRSEIIRQALRLYLTEDLKIEDITEETTATATLIYKENVNRQRLLETQHLHSGLVTTFLHTHMHQGYCLEVIILRGKGTLIKKFMDNLRQNEQIEQIKISIINQK